MPITNREARIIKDIVNSYISPEDARQMFSELVEEVADITDNDSVKQSILMLNTLYATKSQPELFQGYYVVECECGKQITYEDSYRCRICKEYLCEECSLDHFGLVEKDGKVRYRNIFRTIFWFIKKKFLGRN